MVWAYRMNATAIPAALAEIGAEVRACTDELAARDLARLVRMAEHKAAVETFVHCARLLQMNGQRVAADVLIEHMERIIKREAA